MHGVTDGSLAIGAVKKAKITDLERWAKSLPGMHRRGAGICKRLKDAGVVKIARSGIVTIAHWADEQVAAATAEGERKRRERERKGIQEILDACSDFAGEYIPEDELFRMINVRTKKRPNSVSKICELCIKHGYMHRAPDGLILIRSCETLNNDGDSVPVSPPSTFDNVASGSERDMSHTHGVTCHIDRRSRNRESKDSSNSTRASTGGETGTESRFAATVTIEAIQTGSPLDVCEALIGESGKWAGNGFTKKLHELRDKHGEARGNSIFRDCMLSLYNDIKEGAPIRKRGPVLHGKLNKWLQGAPS
jgi:hypothetical protein